jgi:Gas vesicle protein
VVNKELVAPRPRTAGTPVTLADLLDRLLAGGIIIQGEITLAVADIALVLVDLRVLVASIDTATGP